MLNGPEMLNFSAIFLVASLTWTERVEIVLKTKHGKLDPPIHKQFGNPCPPQKTLISSDTILAAKRNLKHKGVDARAQPRLLM